MKIILIFVVSLFSSGLLAQNIHYFGSVTASKSSVEENHITFSDVSNEVTVSPLTTAGVSLDANLNDKYQVLSQFILHNQNKIDLDLLQLRYQFSPDLLVRLGKQRLPTNLLSENIQIQALLPWLNLPREVYIRFPVYSFSGASVEKSFGDKLILHMYGGDTKDDFETEDYTYETSGHNLFGGRLNFNHEDFKAFVNAFNTHSMLNLKSDISATGLGLPAGTTVGYQNSYSLKNFTALSTGFQYRPRDFFIMSEYSQRTSKNALIKRVSAAYVTLGKDLGEKWTTVATFSTDLDVVSQLAPTKTTTYAFNINYRLDFNNVIKFGVEHINYKERTVALSDPLPAPAPQTTSASVFTNGSLGQNFEIYSLMWAFVY
jgi:hypothetical protein